LEGQSTMHLFSFWLEPRQQNILNMKRHGTPTYANFNETWLFSKWPTISRSQSQLCKTTISHSQSQLCNSVVLSQNSGTNWHPFTVLEAGCWIFVLPLGPARIRAAQWHRQVGLQDIAVWKPHQVLCHASMFHGAMIIDDRFPLLNPKKVESCGVYSTSFLDNIL
jgi:hypothetical protein